MSQILLETLTHGDRLEPELMGFVLQAVEILVQNKKLEPAQSLLERALSEDPSSPELLGRMDAISGQVGRDSVRTHRALRGGGRERRRRALAEAHAFDRADSSTTSFARWTPRPLR